MLILSNVGHQLLDRVVKTHGTDFVESDRLLSAPARIRRSTGSTRVDDVHRAELLDRGLAATMPDGTDPAAVRLRYRPGHSGVQERLNALRR